MFDDGLHFVAPCLAGKLENALPRTRLCFESPCLMAQTALQCFSEHGIRVASKPKAFMQASLCNSDSWILWGHVPAGNACEAAGGDACLAGRAMGTPPRQVQVLRLRFFEEAPMYLVIFERQVQIEVGNGFSVSCFACVFQAYAWVPAVRDLGEAVCRGLVDAQNAIDEALVQNAADTQFVHHDPVEYNKHEIGGAAARR